MAQRYVGGVRAGRRTRRTIVVTVILALIAGCSRSEDTYRVDPAISAELPSRADIDAISSLEEITDYTTVLPTGYWARRHRYVRDGPVGYASFEVRAAGPSAPADFTKIDAAGPPRKWLSIELLLYRTPSETDATQRWHNEPPIKAREWMSRADVDSATVPRSEVLRNGRVRLPTPDNRFRYTWCAASSDPDRPVERCLGVYFWMRRCNYLLEIHLETHPLVEIELYHSSLASTVDAIAAATVPNCPDQT